MAEKNKVVIEIYAPRQKLAVVIMVTDENEHLLLVKNKKRGWEFPGGYVDQGETIHEAAIREVQEETGIEVHLTELLGLEQKVDSQTLIIVFAGKKIGGELKSSNETVEVGFFSLDQAMTMMTHISYQQRVQRCLHQGGIPFIIYETGN